MAFGATEPGLESQLESAGGDNKPSPAKSAPRGDFYQNPDSARSLGVLGPLVMRSARAVHARELAKQVMTGDLPIYHRGGIVRKTGPARLLKGEKVLSRKQVRQASGRSRGGR